MEELIKQALIERRAFYEKMMNDGKCDGKQMDFLRGKIAAIADTFYLVDRIERGEQSV